MPQKGKRTVEEESVHSTDAPVSVIDADGMSVVSQITVRMDEFAPAARAAPKKKQDDQQWWWAEELEGWFPSNYVNKALEAAEGFLSAKAIHVKSRPLEFFSDDESEAAEDFSLLKENSSRLSKGHLSSSRASKMGEDEKTNRESPDPTCLKAPSLHGDSGSLRSQAFTSQKSGETKKLHSLESIILETEAALQTLRQERGSQDVGVAALLFQLAKLYQQKDDTVTAIRLGRDALTIQKAGSDVSRVVQTLYLIADLHIHSNEYDQALSCYSEAQRTLEDVHGRYCEEIADTLNRIGNLWTSKNEFESAIESHKQALLVLKECCGEDINHPRVAETMILIGDVYYKERNSLATIQSNADSYSSFIEHGMLEVIARCHEQRGSYRYVLTEEQYDFCFYILVNILIIRSP
jgi:tetratricopeptide (TPR) repeat protein